MTAHSPQRGLTGWHVLIMFVSGFSVIIAVNLTLAYQAVRTFPGLEVANSYVSSQSFDLRRAAQIKLGWTASASYDAGRFGVVIRDSAGREVQPADLTVTVGRPTESAQDVTPHLDRAVIAPLVLAPGKWRVDVEAHDDAGTLFAQQLILWVAP